MLEWLKERLAGESTPSQEEIITDAARIAVLLDGFANNGQMFNARIDQGRVSYETRILDGGTHLLLEELSPIEGHTKVSAGSVLSLEADTANEHISFDTTIDALCEHGNVQAYQGGYPKTIHLDKRRNAPRVKLSGDEAMSLEMTDSRSMDAGLHDLSVHGIGLSVNTDQALNAGDVLKGVTINLPDGQRIQGNVEVRHALPDEDNRQRVGGRFVTENQNDLGDVLNWLADTDGTMEQRRSEPRMALSAGDRVAVQLSADGGPIEATIDNISLHGLSLIIHQASNIQVGDLLDEIQLTAEGQIEMRGSLEVRYVERDGEDSKIGGPFTVKDEEQSDLSAILKLLGNP